MLQSDAIFGETRHPSFQGVDPSMVGISSLRIYIYIYSVHQPILRILKRGFEPTQSGRDYF